MGSTAGFKAALARTLARKRERAAVALDQQAAELANGIRAKAPKRSGRLAESVRVEKLGPLKRRVRAGGPLTTKPVREGRTETYDYALGTEFGTVKEEAAPFFYPTVRARKAGIKRAIRNAMRGDGGGEDE